MNTIISHTTLSFALDFWSHYATSPIIFGVLAIFSSPIISAESRGEQS